MKNLKQKTGPEKAGQGKAAGRGPEGAGAKTARNAGQAAARNALRGAGQAAAAPAETQTDALTFSFLCLLSLSLFDHAARAVNFILLGEALSLPVCFAAGLALFAAALFLTLEHRAISLYAPRFDRVDVFFLGLFFLYFLMKLPFPDSSADTQSYEIFVQEFALTGKALNMKPYIPVVATWFALGNRVLYYFRAVLGFRLTTFANFLIIAVSYYKIKEIAPLLFAYANGREEGAERRGAPAMRLLISFIAFAALFKEYTVLGMVIIKPDLFAIPLLLEFVLLLLKRPAPASDKTYAYAGLLTGFTVAVKLTNLAFVIPVVIYFLFLEYKSGKLNAKNVLTAAAFCALPVLPYMAFNAVTTGNPVFPFYNAVFRSDYYPFINAKDTRWGTKNALAALFFPFVLMLPNRATSELLMNSHTLAIGYAVAVVSFAARRFVPALKKLAPLFACLLAQIFLWAVTTGYGRYMIALEVFAFILIAAFVYALCRADFNKYAYLIFACGVCVFLSLSTVYRNLVKNYWEWSWRPSYTENKDYYLATVKPNLPFIFRDRAPTDDPAVLEKLAGVKTWVCIPYSLYSVLTNPSADFYFFHGNSDVGFTDLYFESHPSDGIYTLQLVFDQNLYDTLSAYGFIVTGCERFSLKAIDANCKAYFVSLMTKKQADAQGVIGVGRDDVLNF